MNGLMHRSKTIRIRDAALEPRRQPRSAALQASPIPASSFLGLPAAPLMRCQGIGVLTGLCS